MDSGDIIGIISVLLLILCSAFFSSSETALSGVNTLKIRTLLERGDKRAITLLKILEKPDKMLSAILIGNNIVNLSASALATSLTLKLVGSYAISFTTGLLTLAVLVFGEISPKTLATREPERIALANAGIIYGLIIILTPIIYLINIFSDLVLKLFNVDKNSKKEAITEEELRTLVEVSHEEGILENEERKIINNVFDFGEIKAKDIMIPRIDMTLIDINAGYDELLSLFRKEQYTRIPVYEDTTDNVVGVINVKDLLLSDSKEDFKIKNILREVLYTYENKNISALMPEMKRTLSNIVIVLDEYGSTAGMLTFEDMLEEIFGEIRDEYDADEMESIQKIEEKEYLIDASLRLDDVNDILETKLFSEDYDSIGGLVMEKLEHLPETGEEVEIDNIKLIVERMDKNRIALIRMYIR